MNSDDRPMPVEPQIDARGSAPRSVFWPIVLIGVGAIWLLHNMQIIRDVNWTLLLRMWPVLLIFMGLDLLVGRRWPVVGALSGLVLVGLVVALLIWGANWGLGLEGDRTFWGLPVINLGERAEVQVTEKSEPLGQAASARVELHLHEGPTTVSALADSADLIQARLTHIGEIVFTASGDRNKTIVLDQRGGDGFARLFSGQQTPWDIRLSPRIPLDLQINGGSGRSELDLSQLVLSALQVRGGSGRCILSLPKSEGNTKAEITGGSGGMDVTIPAGADMDLQMRMGSGSSQVRLEGRSRVTAQIQGGSGSINVQVPQGEPLRIEIKQKGSGSINLPGGMQQVRRDGDREGVWESHGFSDAGQRIVLVLDGGSGSIRIR